MRFFVILIRKGKCYGTPQQQLNLRTLEQRRVDATVIMLCKIIHGLFAILIPSYFEQPMRSTRHTRHPVAFRQIHTTANYYKFPSSPQLLFIGIYFQLRCSVWQCGRITYRFHNSTKTVLNLFYLFLYMNF